jgi:predicted kinase
MAATLIILTGPVGGGKSTVALRLAEWLRALGERVAVVDLDLLADMARPSLGTGDTDLWQTARRACAGLADGFFRQGFDTVIIEGEFFSPAELDALRDGLATSVALQFVTLDVSYEQTLARVSGDPTRGLSRDPAFLRRMHEQYRVALPFLRSVGPVIPADTALPEALAEEIYSKLATAD